jgi:hypothetical protein
MKPARRKPAAAKLRSWGMSIIRKRRQCSAIPHCVHLLQRWRDRRARHARARGPLLLLEPLDRSGELLVPPRLLAPSEQA